MSDLPTVQWLILDSSSATEPPSVESAINSVPNISINLEHVFCMFRAKVEPSVLTHSFLRYLLLSLLVWYEYRARRCISHITRLGRFSKLDCSTNKRVPVPNDMSSESSRRDFQSQPFWHHRHYSNCGDIEHGM